MAALAQRSLVRNSFSALRTRNFRLFFIGQLISNSGNWLTTVGLTLLVLHRTGSGVYVGLVAACQYGPVLLLTAWGGLIADRSNKRNLLFVTQSLEMTESFVLAFLAFLPHAPLPAFFITAVAGGSMLAFDNPGRRSFVNEMVEERDLPNAVTLYSAMSALSRILGPTFAGILIVTLGYGWCFTVDGLSYLIVIGALAMMRPAELRRTPVASRGRGQIRSGIRYLMGVPELRISFTMLLIIGTATYNFTVTFPLLVERGLHGSDTQYTLVYAAFSAGGVLSTMVLARRSRISLRSIVNAAAMVGAAMLALFFVPNVAAACLVAAILGGVGVAYMSSTTAIVQLQPDRAMIGRVIALQTILQIGTTPIGGPTLGFIADTAGPRAPMLVGGLAALGAAALGLVSGRHHLASYRSSGRREDGKEPPAPLPGRRPPAAEVLDAPSGNCKSIFGTNIPRLVDAAGQPDRCLMIEEESVTITEHGFEKPNQPGQVVPDESRPSKSSRMYPQMGLRDAGGHLSPHMLPQPFLPVNGKGGEDLAGPYEVVEGWPKPIEEGWRMASPSGAVVFSADEVVVTSHFGQSRERLTPLVWGRNVFQMDGSPMRTYGQLEKRPEHFVVTFDRDGKLIDSWTKNDHMFGKVNRIFSDPNDADRHLWISDSKRQKIFKFTRGGDLVLQIGEIEAHSVPENPWKAEDIAWLPNGDFYTVGLARIDRFNAAGELQASLLSPGSGPGQFADLHGLVLDLDRHRVLVADRGNSRIQVFDDEWHFLEEWPNIYAPYAMRMQTSDGHIWIADGFTSKFLRYDLEGRLVTSWGQWGIAPGCTWGTHWFDVDEEGDLYVCEVYGERVQKLRRRADVSPGDPRLIGHLHRY